MSRAVNTCLVLALGIGLCLVFVACLAPPERDPHADLRMREDALSARPDPMLSLAEDSDRAIAQWILDLDHENPTRFSRARAGLVRAAAKARASLYATSMPSTTRGKTAALEILMRLPPPEADTDLRSRLCGMLIGVITERTGASAPDTREQLGLRLQAMGWLAEMNRGEDAVIFSGRLLDGERSIRWRAAQYFRDHPSRIRVADLKQLLDLCRGEDLELRTDAASVLNALYWSLRTPEERARSASVSINPIASLPLRQKQIEVFARWLETEATEAIVRKSSEEAIKTASGAGKSD